MKTDGVEVGTALWIQELRSALESLLGLFLSKPVNLMLPPGAQRTDGSKKHDDFREGPSSWILGNL